MAAKSNCKSFYEEAKAQILGASSIIFTHTKAAINTIKVFVSKIAKKTSDFIKEKTKQTKKLCAKAYLK